jgi:hypothetical protein
MRIPLPSWLLLASFGWEPLRLFRSKPAIGVKTAACWQVTSALHLVAATGGARAG